MSLLGWLRKKKTPASASPMDIVARDAEAILRTRPDVVNVTYVRDEGALRVERRGDPPDSPQFVFLSNLLAETREMSPADRSARVRYFLGALPPPQEDLDWEAARSDLLPVLRGSSFGFFFSPRGDLAVKTIARPFLPFLDQRVVLDQPRGMAFVSAKRVESWGVTEDEAFAAAYENLPKLSAPTIEIYTESPGRVLHIAGEDDYAATRLLVPGWLDSLRAQVDGAPLVTIPERSMLFVTGDRNIQAVKWLAETAQREWKSAQRAISPAMYTVDDDGRVVPYLRPGHDDLAHLVGRGHKLLLGDEYAQQKATLDELYKRTETDVFVATASLVEDKQGRVVSYATWTEGVEALIPLTDVIVAGGLARKGQGEWNVVVPFAVARDIAGDAWRETEVPGGPPRLRATGAMSEAQVRALRAAEVALEAVP